jgi:hypothetical protein
MGGTAPGRTPRPRRPEQPDTIRQGLQRLDEGAALRRSRVWAHGSVTQATGIA